MSSASSASTDPAQSALQAPAPSASKKKNNKKKKNANKSKPAPVEIADGDDTKNGGGAAEAEDLSDEPDTPGLNVPKEGKEGDDVPASPVQLVSKTNGHAPIASSNGHAIASASPPKPALETTDSTADGTDSTSAKLEAMSQEREALRVEVEQLRRQLEEVRSSSEAESKRLRAELEESEAGRERAETQYETLLGRVEKIKATLADRLKSDRADLEAANARVEELESTNEQLRQESRAKDEEVVRLRAETHEQGRELNTLRSRTNLSQQNWLKEKDDLTRQVAHLKAELESTGNAMGEWEVIAMEERSMREGLAEKVADLEDQVTNLRELYERAATERDEQALTVDGLQRALGEIQEARKRELREMVESSEEQLQAMKKSVREAEARATEAGAAKESLSKELERTVPFEKEVKEKNLLIGKLRHEAIVLNDHLTKALKYIKKTKPEETIDRQIVTNHFLQFLALDRSDPKKFQILQVIAGLLNWTDEQREQAGLARPGTSTISLRLPTSPFHRTPSSPALNNDFFTEPSSAAGKESLADLWAGFLERSVEEAGGGGGGPSSSSNRRKDSTSSVATAATRPDTRQGEK